MLYFILLKRLRGLILFHMNNYFEESFEIFLWIASQSYLLCVAVCRSIFVVIFVSDDVETFCFCSFLSFCSKFQTKKWWRTRWSWLKKKHKTHITEPYIYYLFQHLYGFVCSLCVYSTFLLFLLIIFLSTISNMCVERNQMHTSKATYTLVYILPHTHIDNVRQ